MSAAPSSANRANSDAAASCCALAALLPGGGDVLAVALHQSGGQHQQHQQCRQRGGPPQPPADASPLLLPVHPPLLPIGLASTPPPARRPPAAPAPAIRATGSLTATAKSRASASAEQCAPLQGGARHLGNLPARLCRRDRQRQHGTGPHMGGGIADHGHAPAVRRDQNVLQHSGASNRVGKESSQ